MSDIVGDKISDMLCHCVSVPTMFAVRHLLLRLDTWQPPERRFYQSSDRVQPTGEGPPTSHRTKALVERDIRDRRYRIKHESSSDTLVLGLVKYTIGLIKASSRSNIDVVHDTGAFLWADK